MSINEDERATGPSSQLEIAVQRIRAEACNADPEAPVGRFSSAF